MIPLLLSVAFGAGVYLLYEGLTNPRPLTPGAAWSRSFQDFLARAGLHGVTPRDFLLFSTGTGILMAAAAQLALGWVVVSLLAGILGSLIPLVYYTRRHDRRRAVVQEALAEGIAQLRDAIRTGLSMQEALIGLARTGPDVLRPEFSVLARDLRFMSFEEALGRLRDRMADPVLDVVAAALLLNDRLGGRNVSQVLDRLVQATRAEIRVQQELRAHQARTVLSARIVAAMPLVVLALIRQVNPRYLSIFDDWSGQLILAGCVVSVMVGYAGMLWTSRLPGERRVLQS